MNKNTWKNYALWILFAEAVGALSGLLLREDIQGFNLSVVQPAWTPPAWLFPIVWGLLFALMGIGAARIYAAPLSGARKESLRLFFVQISFNFLWGFLFFRRQVFGAAFFWLLALWLLIGWMVVAFRKVDRLASRLQWPYWLWVSFAAVLNLRVWMLNG